MAHGGRVSALQVLQSLLFVDDDDVDVRVWLLAGGNPEHVLCRAWLRQGKCRYGSACRYSHTLSFAEYNLRCTHGAAVSVLEESDARSVCYGPPSQPVAFIFAGGRVVFDYEDPGPGISFISGRDADGVVVDSALCVTAPSAGVCVPQGNSMWHLVSVEVAASTLLSAGPVAACRATATCRDWNGNVAQRLRDLVYDSVSGASVKDCTARQLNDVIVLTEFMRAVSSDGSSGRAVSDDVGSAASCTTRDVSFPGDCVAVLLRGDDMIFAVSLTGEVSCYTVATGKLLESTQARRLGKGCGVRCATIVQEESIVFGDSRGGLTLVSCDDLSAIVQLRTSSSAGLLSLVALGCQRKLLSVNDDGCVALFQVNADLGKQAGVDAHIILQIPSVLVVPAIGVVFTAPGQQLLLATTASCLWIHRDADRSNIVCADDQDQLCLEGRSSLAAFSPGSECQIVATATNQDACICWWSIRHPEDGVSATFHGRVGRRVAEVSGSVGGVSSLQSTGDLLVSLHTNGGAAIWHSGSRTCIAHFPGRSWGFVVLDRSLRVLALAGSSTKGRGTQSSIRWVAMCNADAKEEKSESKASGKEKAPKAAKKIKGHQRSSRPQ